MQVDDETSQSASKPPKPEICDKIDIGFNSITRRLQEATASNSAHISEARSNKPPYSMVFVSRGDQTAAFNSHFPQMVASASVEAAPNDKIRLVGFSKACSDRLSATLGIARVSSLAVESEAPGAEALLDFVRKNVSPVQVSWLSEAQDGRYRATKINTIETTVGAKRVKAVKHKGKTI